ncbi:MAG: hypothetical protein RLZZ176_1871, partial [Cyanobacteriota bacterium]
FRQGSVNPEDAHNQPPPCNPLARGDGEASGQIIAPEYFWSSPNTLCKLRNFCYVM